MGSTFQTVQLVTLVTVCVTFALIVVYALWPGNGKSFDEAARLPLEKD